MPSPIEILFAAAEERIGLVISAEGNFQRTAQRLYQAKAKATQMGQNENLLPLQFRRSPTDPEKEIWIVNAAKRLSP